MSTTAALQNQTSPPVCISCHLQAPTKSLVFQQNIGMLFARRTLKMAGPMCRRCARAYFKSYTLTTFFLGWWGTISLVLTPVFIVSNFYQFFKSLGLPEPPVAVANVPYDLSGVTVRVGTPSLKFKLIYGLVIWAVILGFVAEQSVGLVERYAPSLNATLHRGAITDDADAQYAGTKINEDIAALEAETQGKGWLATRTELLAREPVLNDLKTQNGKFQDAIARERANGVMERDPCEQLAGNQLAPALNDYVNQESQFLSILKSNVKLDENAAASIQAIVKQEQTDGDQMSNYTSASKAQGCFK